VEHRFAEDHSIDFLNRKVDIMKARIWIAAAAATSVMALAGCASGPNQNLGTGVGAVGGALLWVLGIATAGYFFGNLPLVREHLDKIIWALIFVPGLLAIFGAWRASRAEKARAQQGA
jgi:hypothetical protein